MFLFLDNANGWLIKQLLVLGTLCRHFIEGIVIELK
jgi:hypothetical protein